MIAENENRPAEPLKWLQAALSKDRLLAAVVAYLLPRILERIWETPALTNVGLSISWGILTYLIWGYLGQMLLLPRLGRLVITLVASGLVAAFVYYLLWKRVDHFTIMFSDTELNGQKISLRTKYDPLKESQVFVETHIQDLFTIQGIWARSDGVKPLEAEAVYLSFSNAVTTRAGYEGQWRPSQAPAGWSTTYVTNFLKNSVEPGHPLPINPFSGGPVPNSPLKARVTVNYGPSKASAEFTINPSDTTPSAPRPER